MSVSFDVLDSLYSIRNVEDLKKRWAEDSKRPQTLSYKAVKQFYECFLDCDPSYIYGANFAMRYREAVKKDICNSEDQSWIMPYVRYAENSKSNSWLASRFDDVCLAFDAIEELEKEPSMVTKKHCQAMMKFFAAIESAYEGNEIDPSMMAIDSPADPNDFNPWELNPEYPEDWNEEDCDSFDPFCYILYLLENKLDTELLPHAEACWKILEEIIEKAGKDFPQHILDAVSIALEPLEMIKNADSRFQSAMNEYRHFKEVKNLLRNDELPTADRLAKIAQLGFPRSYKLKLTYMVEPLVIEYIKGACRNNLSKAELTNLFERLKSLKHIIADDMFKWLSTTFFNVAIYESAIREEERKKVLFEMSHSIKNLVGSVSAPLYTLQEQLTGSQRKTIERALAGASLIRDIAVGVHMSMRGENGVWRKDISDPEFGAATLDKIILEALQYAVSNMFDGKYFAQFVTNYFGSDLDTFIQAQNEWKAAETSEDIFSCIRKYFFDFTINDQGSDLNIPIGDKEGTATKFLIFFQELLLNAVKYCSYTERSKRFVKIEISITPEKWNITISNSATPQNSMKSSGIGLAVIKNFATLFEASYHAGSSNDVYSSCIKFSLTKEA